MKGAHASRRARPTEAAPVCTAEEALEVVAAVRSLYADDVKPFGRLLLKRVREHRAEAEARARGLEEGAVDPETMPQIEPKWLREVCMACRELIVDPEEGKEFSVRLVGEHRAFLDACSPEDPYPQRMWDALDAFLKSSAPGEIRMSGGRYTFAADLRKLNLPFLREYTLGQLCHVVQLAVSQRRILGYKQGALVPFHESDLCFKERCASSCSPLGKESLRTATWEEVRGCLRVLLRSERVTIMNLKHHFRTTFELELSETALGFSRLPDALEDERLRDVCCLVRRNGQVFLEAVSQQQPSVVPPGTWFAGSQIVESPQPHCLLVQVVGALWGPGDAFIPGYGLPAHTHEPTDLYAYASGACLPWSSPASSQNSSSSQADAPWTNSYVKSGYAKPSFFSRQSSMSCDTAASESVRSMDDDAQAPDSEWSGDQASVASIDENAVAADRWAVSIKNTFIHLSMDEEICPAPRRRARSVGCIPRSRV